MRRGVCKNILFDSAMQLIKNDDVKIIDVRDFDEIKSNTIAGSINIPISEMISKIENVIPNKSQTVLVYCSTGSRSIYACQILADLGYNRVYNLQGGLQ